MAVYRWIYANAKMEGNRKDYHVRLCDPGLERYEQTLVFLSKRLLSTEKRYEEAERQYCWFAGYIDENLYVIAVGGDQRELLGVFPDNYRNQHCVLGYGFTEKEIRLLRKDDALFEPLKEIMRKVQRTGKDREPDCADLEGQDYSLYADSEKAAAISAKAPPANGYNIIKSTEETDRALWRQSLQRPVMTGIISVDDAKKLLRLFPGGIVTVMEDVKLQYYEKKETGSISFDEGTRGQRERIAVSENGKILTSSHQLKPVKPKEDSNIKNRKAPMVWNRIKNTRMEEKTGENKEKSRQKDEKREQECVKFCADWCKKKLSPRQREDIGKAIEKLRADESFQADGKLLKQMEYYGYMFFWQKCYKGERQEDDSYIYYSLKTWADRMENETEALKHNLLLALTVKKLQK